MGNKGFDPSAIPQLPRLETRYLLVPLALLFTYFALKTTAFEGLSNKYATAFILSLVGSLMSVFVAWDEIKAPLKFFYSCFLKPIGKHDSQQNRLEAFYHEQAEVYDATRGGLLRGRTTMLKLCAAQLREQVKSQKGAAPIWIDLGGGTGWNIERMDKYFPIRSFHKVYLVDLAPSLCKVARERFEKRGWNNVIVLCEDAANFVLPAIEEPEGKVDLVTMSYSLSMIDHYFPVIDRVQSLLSPRGIFGVADFYVSGNSPAPAEKLSGSQNRKTNWLNRFFWQIWFDFDHVNLAPGRREYLEYKFGTVKCLNNRNQFVIPLLVKIPYYVWIGCDKTTNVEDFDLDSSSSESDNDEFPIDTLQRPPGSASSSNKSLKDVVITQPNVNADPLTAFHYQNKLWRLPYDPSLPHHTQFRSYIYAFTWEDPRVDLQHLNLNKDDSMLVITSAGDNALEYALMGQPKRIHCVDMNPCQNHLLELKLAGISGLDYDDFWRMFGDGRHPDFRELLDDRLSPFLSSHAFQYWTHNSHRFDNKFYKTGYSGLALSIVEWVIGMQGLRNHIYDMCHAKTIEEQKRIWETIVRPSILSSVVMKMVRTPMFCWNALGVPQNQMALIPDMEQYVYDTLDGSVNDSLLHNDQYFYYLCLMQRYCKTSCPSYLTRKGFNQLRSSGALDAFRLHTSTILEVLKSLSDNSLTKSLVMDHMDWFSEDDCSEAEEEIKEFARVTQQGGHVYWRSASTKPWYNKLYAKHGFRVEALGVRESGNGKSIDRVNMYASFYRGVRS